MNCAQCTEIMKRGGRWMRPVVAYEFSGFPRDIAGVIAGYCAELRLRKWINRRDLVWSQLYENYNALESGMVSLDYVVHHDTEQLSRTSHPSAVKLLMDHPNWIDPTGAMKNENPEVPLLCMRRGSGIFNGYLTRSELANSSDFAAEYICKWIASDPEFRGEMAYLFANSNPRIVPYLKQLYELNHPAVNFEYLSQNSSDWAVNVLLQNTKQINKNRFNMNRNPRAIDYLRDHPKMRDWHELSANPAIFEARVPDGLMDVLSE